MLFRNDNLDSLVLYEYKAFNEKELSTIGALYAGKTMRYDEYPDKSVNFELWDTTGMEIYRTLTLFFIGNQKLLFLFMI